MFRKKLVKKAMIHKQLKKKIIKLIIFRKKMKKSKNILLNHKNNHHRKTIQIMRVRISKIKHFKVNKVVILKIKKK